MHHFSLIGKPYKCEFTCMTDKLNKINISLVFHFITKAIRTDFPRICSLFVYYEACRNSIALREEEFSPFSFFQR